MGDRTQWLDQQEAQAMPIYMDRHDLAATTAEEVAQAHLKDLAIQDRYGVKFLTYWFDEAARHGLLPGPGAGQGGGQPRPSRGARRRRPATMVEVELSAVEAFLGRVYDPEPLAPDRPAADGLWVPGGDVHRHRRLDRDDRAPRRP